MYVCPLSESGIRGTTIVHLAEAVALRVASRNNPASPVYFPPGELLETLERRLSVTLRVIYRNGLRRFKHGAGSVGESRIYCVNGTHSARR